MELCSFEHTNIQTCKYFNVSLEWYLENCAICAPGCNTPQHQLETFCNPWVGVKIGKQSKWHFKWNKKFWLIPHLHYTTSTLHQWCVSVGSYPFCLTTVKMRQKMLQPFYAGEADLFSPRPLNGTLPTLFLSNPQISKNNAKCTCSRI